MDDNRIPFPFHPGELQMQQQAGMAARFAKPGAVGIRHAMPDQHRDFFALLPLLFVGSRDAGGQPWASVLTGAPGFAASPDARTLRVDARPVPGDPLAENLDVGSDLGLLGIQLETRRRNRLNGSITALDAAGFTVAVEQSFGNCAQYIQARRPYRVDTPSPALLSETARLSVDARALVAKADTFFIASAAPQQGVDVSHRGGKPGFVRVDHDDNGSVLTAPDFRGNAFFNTMGNIALDPRAGLLFVDFDSGDLLMLAAQAEVIWDGAELAAFQGAERLLRLRITHGRLLQRALPLRWSAPEYAPQLAKTGAWT
ncbi:pyridoxamine 5'-phosphate oxidase family protein [Reyranella sp. CPCC 100927]|uniref:pyridoxamine 5'-phosphate oxidase family protein n=1 Tax=Reyranella sp. CPCC 100927 TaxID=2599616 RepID=UPI0011B844FC|nr:pyridoxamine 5'-phosphate oxidase family protein [Reyranella sp. CPCC 100927]TWT02643.1 flavin-nucleotide-binding protein [Reyranella sp. CPCC 100927]